MKTTTIETTCGIYETETTIRDYGHKVCVTNPYIKWVNNSGTLDFEKATFKKAEQMTAIRKFSDAECLCAADGDMIGNYLDY